MRYRRSQARGESFFFTVVTRNRRPILCGRPNMMLLGDAFRSVIKSLPFKINAFVLLPDHLHCILTLPEHDNDVSTRWQQITGYFSEHRVSDFKDVRAAGRQPGGGQTIWQEGFLQHLIRDDEDYIKHVEYIHYNPVRHGIVTSPKAWPHSTFQKYVMAGIYDDDWGDNGEIVFASNVGSE